MQESGRVLRYFWKEQLRKLSCYVLLACFAELLTGHSLDMPNIWNLASPMAIRKMFASSFILHPMSLDEPDPAYKSPANGLSSGARALSEC